MKNLLLVVFILMPFIQNAQSEASTDKFIRIVGLAEKKLNNEGLKINFTLSEIEGNEYKKIRPKSILDVKNDFITALETQGIEPSKIEEDKMKNITKSNYGKVTVENYSLKVGNEDEAIRISKLELDGFKVLSVEYVFTSTYNDFLNDMTIEAIQDAKRKASNIAKAVGKSIGDILNIEDIKNVDSSGSKYGTKTKTKTLNYRVNVTFELK